MCGSRARRVRPHALRRNAVLASGKEWFPPADEADPRWIGVVGMKRTIFAVAAALALFVGVGVATAMPTRTVTRECAYVQGGHDPSRGDLNVFRYGPHMSRVCIVGKRGPHGAQGPAGEQGPQGIQGLQGIQGVAGPAGISGTAGA